MLNFKERIYNSYKFQRDMLRSELRISKRFNRQRRGWQHNPYRSEKDIMINMNNLYHEMLQTPYRKKRIYTKKPRNPIAPTNIKLYYRAQRKTYFMHYLGKTISNAEY